MSATMITISNGKILTLDKKEVDILEFKDNVVTLLPWKNSTIQDWAEFLEGCFDTYSNFKKVLFNYYKDSNHLEDIKIQFAYDGISMIVTSENSNKYQIFSEWEIAYNKKYERVLIDFLPEMQYKSDEQKQKWQQISFDAKNVFKMLAIRYACSWARCMQHLLKESSLGICDIADHAANLTDVRGITGRHKAMAVDLLVEHWKYGDELYRWHKMGVVS